MFDQFLPNNRIETHAAEMLRPNRQINGLKPYPAYKSSSVPWLGEVPGHWEVQRLKRLATINPRKSEAADVLATDSEVTFLPMERVGTDGRIDTQEKRRASEVWNGFTYFRHSDILVAKITPCFENGKGACLDSLPTEVGFGSTEFYVLRASSLVLPQFLYRVTTLEEFRKLGTEAMTGAAGQQRVPEPFVANFQVVLPPLPEQFAIVRFLDYVDRRIRRFIRAKRRKIDLLNEQKQVIIHQAVTGQIDVRTGKPYPAYKPSGVPWLGDVPDHWEVWKIGHLAKVGNGSTPLRSNRVFWAEDGYPWLNSSCVNQGYITKADQYVTDVALHECHLPRVAPGSVLVAITGQGKTRGKAAMLVVEATINQHMAYITPHNDASSSEYLHLFMIGAYTQLRAISDDSGSTKGALTCEDLKRFRVLMPPREEQSRIVTALKKSISEIEAALARIHREIDLIREYRTRLIADVVTGKLDVREAAGRLPDEIEESEPLDETDALIENNEVNESAGLDAQAGEVEA